MAMYLYVILLLMGLIIIPDLWFFRKMKKHNFYKWFRNLSLLPGLLFIASFFYIRYGLVYNQNYELTATVIWIFFGLVIIYIPKVIYIIFYYINKLFNAIFKSSTRFFQYVGFGLVIFFVVVLTYGAIVTRDDFYLKEKTVYVNELPDGFEKYRIALFADMHLGNWNNRYSIMEKIVRMINKQNPDIIIFAGDMINNFANETEGWEKYFQQLKAKNGMYAVLGNHDYGDYTKWSSDSAKSENLKLTIANIEQLGFDLLNNEHTDLISGNDTISLVGVENYGSGHFDDYADLPAALKETPPYRKKILITHDPVHWRDEVVRKHPDIFLTLSGHTHAAQFGYSKNGKQLSPASAIYPEWDGLYRCNNQYIYVNRGIGYVGIPLRIGVPPEITLIVLKQRKK